jgi:hypothetical protein
MKEKGTRNEDSHQAPSSAGSVRRVGDCTERQRFNRLIRPVWLKRFKQQPQFHRSNITQQFRLTVHQPEQHITEQHVAKQFGPELFAERPEFSKQHLAEQQQSAEQRITEQLRSEFPQQHQLSERHEFSE